MTRDEIQKVIDKGGYLVRPKLSHSLVFRFIKPLRVESDIIFWGCQIHSVFIDELPCPIGASWREATPEEVEKYCK